jgi:hypothetical protein
LRYIEIDGKDAGLELLESKSVLAAYDSKYEKGKYGTHDRENLYRAAGAASVEGC